MRPSPRSPHPLVAAAAALLVVGAAAIGIGVGSLDTTPRPRPVGDEASAEAVSLPTGDGADAITASLDARHGAAVFEQRCGACHTVGGSDRKGPDLAQAALRHDPAWVSAMVAAPDSMFRVDSLARWVLDVHDIAPGETVGDNPDLQALAAYFSSFDPAR